MKGSSASRRVLLRPGLSRRADLSSCGSCKALRLDRQTVSLPVLDICLAGVFRRDGRAAEGAPLLREYGAYHSIEGSNPSLSAS